MDGKERVGTVNWFQKELSSDAPPKLVSTELHSVYDLVLHSHFHFYTGQVVFSIEENPEKSRVGQVLMVNPSGTVLVRWWYGEMEEVYPQAIFPCDPGDEEYPTFGGNPVEAEPQEDIFMEEENEETLAKGHADSADSDSSWETETEDSDAENENLSDKEETVESNRSAREMRLMQLKAKWKFESRRKEIEQKFANMTSMIDQIERGLEVREPTDLLLPKARACGQQLKSICLDFKEFGLWDEVANILSFLETFENRYGPTGQSDTTSSSVHSTAPGFSVLTESTSAVQEERVMETTSSDPEIEAEADVTTTQDVGSIEVLPAVPANNDFFSRSKALENPPKRFMTAVKDELKRLHRGLPPGIFVKAFEDRYTSTYLPLFYLCQQSVNASEWISFL